MISVVREQISAIEPVDERERASIAATLVRLGWPVDPFAERAHSHHLTASGFIVSTRGVLLHRHRRLGIWVQPGGHVDEGEDPAVAAERECAEETGLSVHHLDGRVFHVDVHPGPRGHTHYDLRYVLLSAPGDPHPSPGESPEVFWYDFAAARERAEPALVAALGKLERVTSGVRDWPSD